VLHARPKVVIETGVAHGVTSRVVLEALGQYDVGHPLERRSAVHVQMFIHDSLHTAENTVFEMEKAASAMPTGGVMLVDDIDSHRVFATSAKRHPEYQIILCPDADRNTREGIFGIAVNTANA
jgi:cephalosporin hydroxylase